MLLSCKNFTKCYQRCPESFVLHQDDVLKRGPNHQQGTATTRQEEAVVKQAPSAHAAVSRLQSTALHDETNSKHSCDDMKGQSVLEGWVNRKDLNPAMSWSIAVASMQVNKTFD